MSKSVVDFGDGELEPAHVERCEETDWLCFEYNECLTRMLMKTGVIIQVKNSPIFIPTHEICRSCPCAFPLNFIMLITWRKGYEGSDKTRKSCRKVPTCALKRSNSSVWNVRKWRCCHRLRSLFTFYANSEREVVKRTEKKGKCTLFSLQSRDNCAACYLMLLKLSFPNRQNVVAGHLSLSLSLCLSCNLSHRLIFHLVCPLQSYRPKKMPSPTDLFWRIHFSV